MSTTTTLTTEQIEEAKKQEQIIDNGLSSYVEIGFALRKIQDEKLHEGKFIDYAMDRFALKSHTIYRLMRAVLLILKVTVLQCAMKRLVNHSKSFAPQVMPMW